MLVMAHVIEATDQRLVGVVFAISVFTAVFGCVCGMCTPSG